MNELFSLPDTPSPRLQWMKQHNITTYLVKDERLPKRWSCWSGDYETAAKNGNVSRESTEEESLVEWAKRNGVKLWNEI